MRLYISTKFMLLFILCILYSLKNFQAKITTYAYYRTHFTLQSKSLSNSKCRLLFFLKLQTHTLNECTNLLFKFKENSRTEFFSILLQTFISIFSYILNNGFHTATLSLSTCYTELSSLLLCKINYVIVKMVTLCFYWSSLLSRSLVGQHT